MAVQTRPGSPGVLFPSPAWEGRAGVPDTGGSECSVDMCPFSCHSLNEQFLVLSLGPFSCFMRSPGRQTADVYPWVLWLSVPRAWARISLSGLHAQWPAVLLRLPFLMSRWHSRLWQPFCEASHVAPPSRARLVSLHYPTSPVVCGSPSLLQRLTKSMDISSALLSPHHGWPFLPSCPNQYPHGQSCGKEHHSESDSGQIPAPPSLSCGA